MTKASKLEKVIDQALDRRIKERDRLTDDYARSLSEEELALLIEGGTALDEGREASPAAQEAYQRFMATPAIAAAFKRHGRLALIRLAPYWYAERDRLAWRRGMAGASIDLDDREASTQ